MTNCQSSVVGRRSLILPCLSSVVRHPSARPPSPGYLSSPRTRAAFLYMSFSRALSLKGMAA